MKKVWPDADRWLQMCNIKMDPHHGGTVNGNGCRLLLRSTDKLAANCSIQCLPFVMAFRAFETVVNACFSSNLDSNYKTFINEFKTYFDLEISITPKVHAVIYHIPEFCDRHQRGLGLFSEQASEAVHSNFAMTMENYKFNDTHCEFPSQLLKAVNAYNSLHLL